MSLVLPDKDRSMGDSIADTSIWPAKLPHEQFTHFRFDENTDPLKCLIARKTQAADYLTKNFVLPSAVDSETGLFYDGIDYALGGNVDYYLAIKGESKSTLRMINVPEAESVYSLPALDKCESTLSEKGKEVVNGLDNDRSYLVKEFGALASTGLYGPVGIFEEFDRVVDEAIYEEKHTGKEVAWLFSIVESTLNSLRYKMGDSAFEILGEGTPIEDPRVKEDIRIVPTRLSPGEFRDNLVKDMMKEGDIKRQRSLAATVMHFTKAVDLENSSELITQGRQVASVLIGRRKIA